MTRTFKWAVGTEEKTVSARDYVSRLLALIVLASMSVPTWGRQLLTTYAVHDNAFAYRVYDDNTATLVGIYAQHEVQNIPQYTQIESGGSVAWKDQYFRVTHIASDAFSSTSTYTYYNTSTKVYNATLVGAVKKLTGGEGLESIGTNALGNLPNLTEVELGGGYAIFTKDNMAPLKSRLVSFGYRGDLPESVCEGFTQLKTVTANSGGRAIGNRAFYGCTSLTSFTSNYCPESIGDEAFQGCSNLVTFSLNSSWGEALTSIGNYAFYNCYKLNSGSGSNLDFSTFTSLQSIGDYAFGHTDIQIVDLRNSSELTTIGAAAFRGCTELTSCYMPSSLLTLGESAFSGCTNLGRWSNSVVDFTACTRLKAIGKETFKGCNYLKRIDLSNCAALTSIGDYAFSENTNLYEVKLPSSLTSIGNYAFYHCYLKSVTLPSKLTKIGDHAFGKCAQLTSINFPTTLTTIGKYAFEGTGFVSITWPYAYMPEGLFKNSISLQTFDASATKLAYISDNAFEGCHSLGTVKFNSTYMRTIGKRAFYKTYYKNAYSSNYDLMLTITGISNVTEIGEYAFAVSTIHTFFWPKQITTIPKGVFAGSALTKINIPEGVTTVALSYSNDSAAFSNLPYSISKVEIPSTMTNLNSAFNGSVVDTLIMYSSNCQSSSSCWSSSGTSIKYKAYVPYSKVSMYKSGNGTYGYRLNGYQVSGWVPNSIKFEPASATIYRGKTVTIKPVPMPGDASPELSTYWPQDYTSRVNNSDNTFTFTGQKGGVFEIVAQSKENYKNQNAPRATFKLTVLEPDTVLFDENLITLAIGSSRKLTPTVVPADKADQTISYWSSSDNTVCSVLSDGTVKAINSGTAIITAYTPGRATSGQYIVEVPVLENQLDKGTLVLKPGESAKLNASVYGSTVYWSSDNEAVATVDSKGNVLAISEGVATITTSIPEDAHSHAKCLVIVTTEKVMYQGGIYYSVNEDDPSSVKVTNLAFSKEGFYGPADDRDEYSSTISIPAQITADDQTYNVTEIGNYAFYRMQRLDRVNVPASVKKIGHSAFEGSENLKVVTFATGSQLESIEYNAFKGCIRLEELSIPNGVKTIADAAFMNCKNLLYLTLPAILTEISPDLCRGCAKLDDLTLPAGVILIGKAAFRDCTRLNTITYPTQLSMIDEEAFMNCSALSTVTLPGKVASLQNNAYEGCTALRSFVFPATIEGIGALCFKGCAALKSVQFKGSKIVSFGENAFAGCSGMNVSIANIGAWAQSYFANIGANPLANGGHLLQNGSELTAITLPSTVTYVGQYAFAGATSVTNITLPSSVKVISDDIASDATTFNMTASTLNIGSRNAATLLNMSRSSAALMTGEKLSLTTDANTTVTWSTDNASVATVKNGEVTALAPGTATITAKTSGKEGKCLVVVGTEKPVYVGALYYNLTAEGNAVVTNLGKSDAMAYPMDKKRTEYSGILNIPAAVTYKGVSYPVTEVGMQAFYAMEHLQKAIIPASVTTVGMKAFEDAGNLARVEFASGSKCSSIAQRAFYGCTKLDAVVLPGALTMLNKELFRKCESLRTITLPASLTTIGEYAFAECTALPSVTLTSKVASLQNYAFDGCTAMTSLIAPASLEGIGALCFNGCTKLQSIQFQGTKPISIGESAFKGCTAMTKVTVANLAAWVQSYFATPWSNPTTMAHHLYVGSSEQKGNVSIPSTAAYVAQYAFSGCTAITGVTLPDNVTAFSDGILRNCGGTAITKGENTLDLSTRDAATTLELDRNSVVMMPGETITLKADASAVTWESSNTAVATVASDGKVTVLSMGTAVITAKAAGKTGKCMVTVSAMAPAYVGAYYYKYNNDGTATLTNAANGVVAFGTERYDYAGIVSVPASVTYDGKTYTVSEVGNSAFYKMAHLQKAILPASITTIGSQAFESADKMKRIEFASGSQLKNIITRAFYECKMLNNVVLPNGVTTINEATFRYCEALTDITLPANLATINEYAFANCKSLVQIKLPAALTAIQDYAFSADTKLASLELPVAMNGIGKYTFQNCTALKSVRFMNQHDMTIGESAFSGCTALTKVEVDNLDAWVMTNYNNDKSNPLYYAKALYQADVELTKVNVPSTAKYVNQYAFINAQHLTTIDLPATIETVGNNIFLGCAGLTTVICRATRVPRFIGTVGNEQSGMTTVCSNAVLQVPADKISSYSSYTNVDDYAYWAKYKRIEALVETLPGDADMDGDVDDDDIAAIRNFILGRATSASQDSADVDGDGRVTVSDVIKAIKLKKK